MSYRVVHLGELAHVVGQQATAGSPRGSDPLPDAERDLADNLMLLCGDDHEEIDDSTVVDDFTTSWLLSRKRAHEDRIHHLTGLTDDRSTTVVRMVGNVRGRTVELTRETAAMAVIRSADRYPLFLESYSRHGIEIDLRALPEETAAGPDYYRAASAVIDSTVARLREGATADSVTHLSVFGFARLPLLVYLGSSIDDTIATDIYQRHRVDEGWYWSSDAPIADFTVSAPEDPATSEAVLLLSVSGTIQALDVPPELAGFRRYHLGPSEGTAHPDMIRRRQSLVNFDQRLRGLLSHLEETTKTLTRLHVLPALPVCAAVTLGRVHDPQVHPTMTIYDRGPRGYLPAMEITSNGPAAS
jgi:hypothetical protein